MPALPIVVHCSECGEPNAEGLLICYFCANLLEEQRRALGVPTMRARVDGRPVRLPGSGTTPFVACSACGAAEARILGGGARWCGACGFLDGS